MAELTWKVSDEEARETDEVAVDLLGGEAEVGDEDEDVGEGEGEEAEVDAVLQPLSLEDGGAQRVAHHAQHEQHGQHDRADDDGRHPVVRLSLIRPQHRLQRFVV